MSVQLAGCPLVRRRPERGTWAPSAAPLGSTLRHSGPRVPVPAPASKADLQRFHLFGRGRLHTASWAAGLGLTKRWPQMRWWCGADKRADGGTEAGPHSCCLVEQEAASGGCWKPRGQPLHWLSCWWRGRASLPSGHQVHGVLMWRQARSGACSAAGARPQRDSGSVSRHSCLYRCAANGAWRACNPQPCLPAALPMPTPAPCTQPGQPNNASSTHRACGARAARAAHGGPAEACAAGGGGHPEARRSGWRRITGECGQCCTRIAAPDQLASGEAPRVRHSAPQAGVPHHLGAGWAARGPSLGADRASWARGPVAQGCGDTQVVGTPARRKPAGVGQDPYKSSSGGIRPCRGVHAATEAVWRTGHGK